MISGDSQTRTKQHPPNTTHAAITSVNARHRPSTMVRKMRDLDQGYDYETLDKKTKMLRKHRFFSPPGGVKFTRGHGYCWPIVTLLVVLWVLFLMLWMYSRSKGIGLYTVTQVKVYPASLVRIPPELANKNGAFCLDGTVPTYYFRKGKDRGKRSWMVHLAGGGMCWDLMDCYLRSFSALGSSDGKYLPTHMELNGVHSDKPDINPDFHDWNMAYVNYCDGAAFSGNIPYPLSYENKTLYFRGALVLDLIIKYLVESAGMGDADKIILSGNSAGGQAVVLHIDHVKTLIPEGIPFHGLVDAGIFLDARNMTNFAHFRICSQRVYNLQQVWGSLNEDCVNSNRQPQDNRWKCFFTEYAYQYVKTPIFYINSLYDYWGLWFILEMHCHPTICPEKISFMNDFHKQYLDLVKEMRNKTTKNGMFISTCYAHNQAMGDGTYTSFKVTGKTAQEALGDWYYGRVPEGESFYFDCEDPYDCNPSCDWSLEFYEEKTATLNQTRKCYL